MFKLVQGKTGKFHFTLQARNRQVILTSQAYHTRAAARGGIASVKKNAPDDARYERKTAANGKFHFNLKAGNSQIIGSSQMYADEAGRENGIASVKTNAPDATIEDETA